MILLFVEEHNKEVFQEFFEPIKNLQTVIFFFLLNLENIIFLTILPRYGG